MTAPSRHQLGAHSLQALQNGSLVLANIVSQTLHPARIGDIAIQVFETVVFRETADFDIVAQRDERLQQLGPRK